MTMPAASRFIASLIGTGISLLAPTRAWSAAEFNNITFVVELKTEKQFNNSIHKRAMIIKFPNGRTNRVRLSKIRRWAYTNQSELKGFIFTWVKHRHVFGISFKNIDGDTEQMAVAFDDSQYVQPFTFFLEGTGPAFD